jgi:hypothetical protein
MSILAIEEETFTLVLYISKGLIITMDESWEVLAKGEGFKLEALLNNE